MSSTWNVPQAADLSWQDKSADFQTTIEKAVADKRIAGGAAIVVDRSGREIIKQAFGKTSTSSNARPFTFDTTFWIASSTKLLTSICALKCVEQGHFKLDDDIALVLPQWKDPKIITGVDDDGKPKLVPAKEKLTLRRLLTHSSGMTYPDMSPLIISYRNANGLEIDSLKADKINDYYLNPLIFEPGSAWAYGPSIDWAGQMVEKVSGLKLGEYMKKNIFEPVGMKYSSMDPVGNEAVESRLTGRVGRDAETGLVGEEKSGMCKVQNRDDHHGGSGVYSCAEDYIKVLTSLLLDDGRLLAKGGDMIKELFRPQLEHPAAFTAACQHEIFGAFFAPGLPRGPETSWDYALGGAVVAREIPGQANKGTLFWSGYANNYWFIDREAGVAGCYSSWILPAGDAQTGAMFRALQEAALKQIKEGAKL